VSAIRVLYIEDDARLARLTALESHGVEAHVVPSGDHAVAGVIDNLLENVHEYTPETLAPILLAVRGDEHASELEIIDRAAGIANADRPNLCDSFFRAERSRSRETGGVVPA
jgi:signal transduction histidine kinase